MAERESIMTRWWIPVCAIAFAWCVIQAQAEPVYELHFEQPEDLAKLQADRDNRTLSQVRGNAAVGDGALLIDCMLDGNYSIFRLPRDLPQGRLTLWFRDPLFDGPRVGMGFRPAIRVQCKTQDSPKKQYQSIIFDTGREDPYWWVSIDEIAEHGVRTDIPRHGGWTRLDVVNPGGEGPRPFILYIDGREAMRTWRNFISIDSLTVNSGWGVGKILIDEVVYDDDPASFEPNPVQQIRVADESGEVRLSSGDALNVELKLGDRAAGRKGKLELQDMRGDVLQGVSFQCEASPAQSQSVKLSSPPRSGIYRLVTSVDGENGQPSASTSRWVDVQFIAEPFKVSGRGGILFTGPWQWLPGEPGDSVVPTDWSKSQPVTDAWYYAQGRERKSTAGWYSRTVKIPADWTNRRIVLSIDDPQSKVTVYIGDKPVGQVVWPGGEVDITSYAHPGAEMRLVIFCTGLPDASFIKVLHDLLGEKAKLPSWVSEIKVRGLRGEVELRSEPKGARLTEAFVETSIKDNALRITFRAEGLTAGGTYRIAGAVCAAGKVVRGFEASGFAIDSTGNTGTLSVMVSAADLRRWEIGDPYLYDLQARLIASDGTVADSMPPQRFGVRQIGFEGRNVVFNDRPITLFMPPPMYNFSNDGFAAYLRKLNLNFLSGNHLGYYWAAGWGTSSPVMDHYRFCDETGVGADVPIWMIDHRKLLIQHGKQGAPEYWRELERVAQYVVRRYRNHPSVFFYNAPVGGQMEMGGMFNPLLMDGRWIKDYTNKPPLAELVKVETRVLDLLHAADPSRRVVSQDSGNFGDCIHITHYAGFMQIQEMIETDQIWLKYGDKPYFITEQDAPMNLNWTNACREMGSGTLGLVPYDAEWCAITLGDRAFHRDVLERSVLVAFEKSFENIHKRDPSNNRTYWPPAFPPFVIYNDTLAGVRNEVWGERMKEQWLNWRADGIGMLCSWNTSGLLNGETQGKYYAPITAFIAGTPDSRTAKDHLFAPGETMARQIIVLNNTAEAQTVECRWVLSLGGSKVSGRTDEVTVAAGGQSVVPVRFTFPLVGGDQSGMLNMTLLQGGKTLAEDQVEMDVLVPRQCRAEGKIAVIDPEVETADALRRLGVKFDRVAFNADLTGYDMVIFGRRAFDYETLDSARGVDLGRLTSVGKTVLIMEQDEDTLRDRFNFRTEYASTRCAYGRVGNSAVTEGLGDRALRYWRGRSTLSDGYAVARRQDLMNVEHNGARWFYRWNDGADHARPIKWGDTHNVATVVVLKPDVSAYRTLIDCEFGLNYAAVWELDNGPGRIVFNQMDCIGRTEADPAADRLLCNLVQYAATGRASATRRVAYIGGPVGGKLLSDLRIESEVVTEPGKAGAGQLLVLGEMPAADLAGMKAGLEAFVRDGGTVFSMARGGDALGAEWLPFSLGVKAEEMDCATIDKPVEPLLAGLGNGDFYWKGKVGVTRIVGAPEGAFVMAGGLVASVPYGRGRYVFCQIDPSLFDVAGRFYLKESRQFSFRTIRTLLTNLGARATSPLCLAAPVGQEKLVIDIDLAGTWQGCTAKGPDDACPAAGDARWKDVQVPGFFDDQRGEWAAYDGYFWYRTTFTIPRKLPEDAVPHLVIGAIDDEDDTFVNGKKVGHTGRDTNQNDYYMTLRQYAVPREQLRPGRNELTVLVRDMRGSGGINPGPVKLAFVSPAKAKAMELARAPYLFEVGKTDDPYSYNGW